MSKQPHDRPLSPLPLIAGGILVAALLGFAFWRHAAKTSTAPATAPPQTASIAPPAATPAGDEEAAKAAIPRITVPELKALVDKKAVTLIDVRDADSYLAGHIPGALHIPMARIEGEIPYLPKDKPIVTYCT
jgi:3-mercaptopyruvate sulfurtransferase SseA